VIARKVMDDFREDLVALAESDDKEGES
jgi:hypothetical protein